MRSTSPIFHPASAPAPRAPGLSLHLPEGPSRWIHGALALDAAEATPGQRAEWLESIVLAVATDADGQPHAAPLLRARVALGDPFREVVTESGARLAWAGFSVEAGEALGVALPGAPCHVHLSARRWCSPALRVRWSDAAGDALLGRPAEHASDRLVSAYARAASGDHAGALDDFEAALAVAALRADLDRPHLYNAACVAARLATERTGDARAGLLQRGLAWLREDLARCEERLAALAATPDDPRTTARRALLERHRAARRDDPDLSAYR